MRFQHLLLLAPTETRIQILMEAITDQFLGKVVIMDYSFRQKDRAVQIISIRAVERVMAHRTAYIQMEGSIIWKTWIKTNKREIVQITNTQIVRISIKIGKSTIGRATVYKISIISRTMESRARAQI